MNKNKRAMRSKVKAQKFKASKNIKVQGTSNKKFVSNNKYSNKETFEKIAISEVMTDAEKGIERAVRFNTASEIFDRLAGENLIKGTTTNLNSETLEEEELVDLYEIQNLNQKIDLYTTGLCLTAWNVKQEMERIRSGNPNKRYITRKDVEKLGLKFVELQRKFIDDSNNLAAISDTFYSYVEKYQEIFNDCYERMFEEHKEILEKGDIKDFNTLMHRNRIKRYIELRKEGV